MPGWLLNYIRHGILMMSQPAFAAMLKVDTRTLRRWENSEEPLPFHCEFRPNRIILKHDGAGFGGGLSFIIFERVADNSLMERV